MKIKGGACPETGAGRLLCWVAFAVPMFAGCAGGEQTPDAPAAPSAALMEASDAAPIPFHEGALEVLSFTLDSIVDMQGVPVAAVEVEEPDLVLHFTAEGREDARIWILDPATGVIQQQLYAGRVKPGLNAFRFQHDPLPKGLWEVVVAFQGGLDTVQTVRFNKK